VRRGERDPAQIGLPDIREGAAYRLSLAEELIGGKLYCSPQHRQYVS